MNHLLPKRIVCCACAYVLLLGPAPTRAAPAPQPSPSRCKADLQLKSVTADLLSDWAAMSIEAELVLNCGTVTNQNDDIGAYETELWPRTAAMWEFSSKNGSVSLPASIIESEAADTRFASQQAGALDTRGHLLAFERLRGAPTVSVRPLALGERITIAYTALLPTVYGDGVHRFEFPQLPAGSAPNIALRFPRGGELLSPQREHSLARTLQAMRAPRELTWRSLTTGLEAELVGFPTDSGSYQLGWRIRAGSILEAPPANAQLAIVIDTSRSLTAPNLAQAASVARTWIRAHSDPEVGIILVDRSARPLTRGFIPASEAIAALDHFSPELHDGSAIELGLAAASELLRRKDGQKRVLLLTDGFLDQSITQAQLNDSFPDVGQSLVIGYIGRHEDDIGSKGTTLNQLALKRRGYFDYGTDGCVLRGLVAPRAIEKLSFGPAIIDDFDEARIAAGTLPAGEAFTREVLFLKARNKQGKATLRYRMGSSRFSVTQGVDPTLSLYESAWAAQRFCVSSEHPEYPAPNPVLSEGYTHFVSIPGHVPSWSDMTARKREYSEACVDRVGAEPGLGSCFSSPGGEAMDDRDTDVVQRLLGRPWQTIAHDCGATEASVEVTIVGDELDWAARFDFKPKGEAIDRCLRLGFHTLTIPDGRGPNYRATGKVSFPGPILGPFRNPKRTRIPGRPGQWTQCPTCGHAASLSSPGSRNGLLTKGAKVRIIF